MMEQNTDFCSLSSADMFKSYLESFSESQFNQGNCPIDPVSNETTKLIEMINNFQTIYFPFHYNCLIEQTFNCLRDTI